MAPLRAGQPERERRAWVFTRRDFFARRHLGGFGRPGGPDSRARQSALKNGKLLRHTGTGWAAKKDGAERAISLYRTQAEAVSLGGPSRSAQRKAAQLDSYKAIQQAISAF